jgi:activator of HSP90 ATPase
VVYLLYSNRKSRYWEFVLRLQKRSLLVMRTATLHQLVMFGAPPERVYEALMNSAMHTEFTGAPAAIHPHVGGDFTAHGPSISGTNVALEPGRTIVQRWRVAGWPTGHYSTVHYSFEPSDRGTLLRFMHQDIPSDLAKEIDVGWEERYWKPLKKYLVATQPKTKRKAAASKPKKAKAKAKKKR